jgi:hypothetical protein
MRYEDPLSPTRCDPIKHRVITEEKQISYLGADQHPPDNELDLFPMSDSTLQLDQA